MDTLLVHTVKTIRTFHNNYALFVSIVMIMLLPGSNTGSVYLQELERGVYTVFCPPSWVLAPLICRSSSGTRPYLLQDYIGKNKVIIYQDNIPGNITLQTFINVHQCIQKHQLFRYCPSTETPTSHLYFSKPTSGYILPCNNKSLASAPCPSGPCRMTIDGGPASIIYTQMLIFHANSKEGRDDEHQIISSFPQKFHQNVTIMYPPVSRELQFIIRYEIYSSTAVLPIIENWLDKECQSRNAMNLGTRSNAVNRKHSRRKRQSQSTRGLSITTTNPFATQPPAGSTIRRTSMTGHPRTTQQSSTTSVSTTTVLVPSGSSTSTVIPAATFPESTGSTEMSPSTTASEVKLGLNDRFYIIGGVLGGLFIIAAIFLIGACIHFSRKSRRDKGKTKKYGRSIEDEDHYSNAASENDADLRRDVPYSYHLPSSVKSKAEENTYYNSGSSKNTATYYNHQQPSNIYYNNPLSSEANGDHPVTIDDGIRHSVISKDNHIPSWRDSMRSEGQEDNADVEYAMVDKTRKTSHKVLDNELSLVDNELYGEYEEVPPPPPRT